ncbi:MAG TPA: galactokinase [Acidimicrobiia bacterium]|nr:galactokinase [Acidimicrobiia bacterium]
MRDQVTAHAPGRVNLIGEHTDYSGGLVLPMAIDLGVTVAGHLGGSEIALRSQDHTGDVRLPAGGGGDAPPTGWGRYVAAVVAELAEAGRPAVGFTGTISSDLPEGSGLSSSAALSVAVAFALCGAAEYDPAPMELALLCQRAEQRAVGVPVGVMDQAASILGRDGRAVLLDCGSLEHRLVPLPPTMAVLVVDSGISRQLELSGYSQRRGQLEEGLDALGIDRPSDLSPADLPDRPPYVPDLLYRRVRHVVTENDRVRQMVAALTSSGDPDQPVLGGLFAQSHASLRDDYEVSLSEIDMLVDIAIDEGAIAARLTGGGFGGAIVVLVDAAAAVSLGERVAARYQRETGLAATVRFVRPSEGARVEIGAS